jgi:hypothetical protein
MVLNGPQYPATSIVDVEVNFDCDFFRKKLKMLKFVALNVFALIFVSCGNGNVVPAIRG